jgi:hypothetical protein
MAVHQAVLRKGSHAYGHTAVPSRSPRNERLKLMESIEAIDVGSSSRTHASVLDQKRVMKVFDEAAG